MMDFSKQVILEGENLGERHHYLNNLVQQLSKEKIQLESLPGNTPINKILKIDLANSLLNVDYILLSLKENDMLYVSRALKSTWLLNSEYSNVINPSYLETLLYPEMIKPAVNKMKHWIQIKLKNIEQCQQFYDYYKSNYDESIKFLWHCSQEFIIAEFFNIIEKLTPKHLKILCEVCPQVAKMYFEGLQKNPKARTQYCNDASNYFKSITCVLKLDGNMYLEILESYFDEDRFKCLSPATTHYIMVKYKQDFLEKQELYTSKLLNINTLANCLTSAECRELLFALAKAEYLDNWFTYRSVEPLIKRIAPEERSSLKKLIFMDKSVGEKVKDWPYKTPTPIDRLDLDEHIFNDDEREYYDCDYLEEGYIFKSMVKKRKYCGYAQCAMSCPIPQKTMLDQLFSRYRFAGFSKTFTELRGRLQAATSLEERQNIMLVLVSKSGQVPSQVEAFVKLLVERHTNEPSNLRAAVVRSLVKRGCFWRVTDDIWTSMLTFAHGLGLDGRRGDPLCVEGLHAVVLRHLTRCSRPAREVLDSFKKNFTTFKEYKLDTNEIKAIKDNLPPLLLPECPNEFLQLLNTYRIKIENIEGAVDLLAKAAVDNPDLINILFDSKIARRQLIQQTFPVKQFEASYINALRHNVALLADGDSFADLVSKEKANHDRFLHLLRIYFSEVNGLAAKHLTALEVAFNAKAELQFVRPLAILSSNHIVLKKIEELDHKVSKKNIKLAAAFKANAHKCEPPVDIGAVEWKLIGAKAVANKMFISKAVSLDQRIRSCLQWRPAYAIALRLALDTPLEVEAFSTVNAKRPIVALKIAVCHYFSERRTMNPQIWEIVKTTLLNTNLEKLPKKLYWKLTNGDVPSNIQPDFWTTIYQAKSKIKRSKAESALNKLGNMLSAVDSDFIAKVITDFINDDLTVGNFTNYTTLSACGVEPETKPNISNETSLMYFRIAAKYLLLCKSEDERTQRIQRFLIPLFERTEGLWNAMPDNSKLLECIDEFLRSLKYTEVFIDTRYVSCIPTFDQIINRLRNFMPRKEYFEKYVKLHFMLLYFKAIRHAVGQDPEMFNDESKGRAMEAVGTRLGQYVGSEISELASEFFASIVDIYREGFKDFLSNYFPYNKRRHAFVSCVVKGLLKNNNLEAQLVAEHIFYSEFSGRLEENEDILNVLKTSEHKEVQFFLHAKVYG